MSSRVQGFRVREPRVVIKSGPSSQRGSTSTTSKLAQAWAAFGEAKSVLEKLDSCPSSKSSHTHTVTHAVTMTTPTAAGGRRLSQHEGGSVVNGLTDEKGQETVPEGMTERGEPPAGSGRHMTVNGTETSLSGRIPSRGARDGSKKRGRRRGEEKDGRGRDLKAHPSSTAKTTPHTTTNITPSHTPHTNMKAIFGPPVNFGVAPSTSVPPKPFTPGDSTWTKAPTTTIPTPSTVPSTAQRTGSRHAKIELPEDTLATLRSKVEAQKLAVEATNSRLQSLRQLPEPSDLCLYPLPEVTESFASTTLPTSTTSHPHPHPHPHLHPQPSPAASRETTSHQPRPRKVTSVPPPTNPTRAAHTSTLSPAVTRPNCHPLSSSTRGPTGGVKVRKIGQVSAPVDPLRTRQSTAGKTTTTKVVHSAAAGRWAEDGTGTRRNLKEPKQKPPHNRSWALRPASSNVMTVHVSDVELESSDTVSVSSEKPSLVPLGMGAHGEEQGQEEEGRGSGGTYLSQMLQELEASPVDQGESDERQRGKMAQAPKRLFQSSSSSTYKRRKLTDPEETPLPPPPHTKPYNHTDVQRYMRRKQRERRMESQRQQEQQERERREREQRKQELMQRQRRIVQANLRGRHRVMVERGRDAILSSTEASPPLLTVTSPYSTTPRVPPYPPHSSPPRRSQSLSPHRTTYSSPRSSSHHSSPQPAHSLSPHTYTIPSNPQSLAHSPQPSGHAQIENTTHYSGIPPPYPVEPFQTTRDQQSNREERIHALTQSALELKRKIAAEAERLKRSRKTVPLTRSSPHTASRTKPSPWASNQGSNNRVLPTLPGVQSVHRHARLAEEARREGEAAVRIQAAFRGYRVRKSLQWPLPSGFTLRGSLASGRVGDGEEDGSTGVNGTMKTSPPYHSVAVQTASTMAYPPSLKAASTTTGGSVSNAVPPADPARSREFLIRPPAPTAAPTATPQPWQKGGGDPLSVINIFTRQKGQLEDTLSQLRTQKLSELRELKMSHTPSDHTHLTEVSHTSSFEEKSTSKPYSLSFPSPSPSLQNERPPIVKSHSTPPHSGSSPSLVSTLTATPPSHSHPSHSHPSHSPSQHSPLTTPHDAVDPKEDVPAITPPGSPSFVDTFSANISSPRLQPPQPPAAANSVNLTPPPAAETSASRGAEGGRLSPRSLSLKLQAELTLLETIEESMRQLAAVEGSQAVSTAQQETATLAQLLETQEQKHQEELTSVTARAQAMAEERKKQEARAGEERAAVLAELEQVKGKVERRERQEEREGEMARRALEATQQLAEARSAANEAVISSARLQMEAAHSMAVSVATAAAREAVTVAMAGVTHPPPPPASTQLTSGSLNTTTASSTYRSDFEDNVQPDSLAEETIRTTQTEVEAGVPVGTSSGDSTLTPVLSAVESDGGGGEGEGEESESHTSVQEEIDEGDEVCRQSFHELLPSESHRRKQSQRMHLSLNEPDSHGSSPAHSCPLTPSALSDRSSSPFMAGEDSFFQFMSRMMEQYMKEEEVRSRHRALLLQLREKTLKEKTSAELEWLKVKQQKMRGKGEDDHMPLLETRQRGLLKKLEAEQAEIRKLQRVQQEASREHRLMMEQHREISHLHHSAKYYRDKLRRYSMRDTQEHLTPSPSHHSASPVPSEVPSQISEAEEESPSHTQPAYSPSHTPPPHSSPHHTVDQSPSVTMPTDTVNTTPTIDSHTTRELKKLAHHDRYLTQREKRLKQRRLAAEAALRQQEELLRREQELDEEERKIDSIISQAMSGLHHTTARSGKSATKKSPLMVTTPTTHDDQSQSDVISEVLDHTPSESVPEEVSDEATPTVTQLVTEYSSDTFETPDPTLPSSHTLPVTSTPAQLTADQPLDLTGGSSESLLTGSGAVSSEGSLEVRISQLRQQLEQRRAEVRRARGEQRQRKRALLREQEDRLRKKLETLDSQLARLQSSPTSPLSNHLPSPSTIPSSHSPPSPHHTVEDTETKPREKPDPPEQSYTPLSGNIATAEEESGGEEDLVAAPGQERQEEMAEDEDVSEAVSESSELLQSPPPPQEEGATSPISDHVEEEGEGEIREDHEEDKQVEEGAEEDKQVEEGAEEGAEEDGSYTESWPSDHGSPPLSEAPATSSSAMSPSELQTDHTVGQRVLVGGAESGTIRFIGPTHFKQGLWIGVELDADKGKNDGSIDGQRYFTCPPGHGVFAPASKVTELVRSSDHDVEDEMEGGRMDSGDEVEEEGGGRGSGEEEEGGGRGSGEEEEEGRGNDSEVGRRTQSNAESSIVEDMEDSLSGSGSEDITPLQLMEGDPTDEVENVQQPPSPSHTSTLLQGNEEEGERDIVSQGNEGEDSPIATALIPDPEESHLGPPVMSEVEGSSDLESSSPAIPPPLTPAQEEVSTAPGLPAPPPDIAKEAPEQTAESQGAHLPSTVDHLATDLVQELANEAFNTMHKIWRHKSPPPTSPTAARGQSPFTNHHMERTRDPHTEVYVQQKARPELSKKADRITDQLFALLLKSETELVCTLRSAKNSRIHSEPTSPPRHSPSGLFTPPSLPTIQETSSPPSSPPPSPPPFLNSPTDAPPGSPPFHLPSASAARVAAGERSPPIHRETSPPSVSRSLSCTSLSSLIDKQDFTSAHYMVPSNSDQIDTIVQHVCTLWRDSSSSEREGACQIPECPSNLFSLFSSDKELSSTEVHCRKAYIRLVYDLTVHVLQETDTPQQPVVSVWTKHSPTLNSQVTAAKKQSEEFDLEKVQKRVHALMVRGQLPSQLPPVKFLHGRRRVGGKDIDFIDSVLIHELRREESGWVDYHQDEVTAKLRAADGILASLLTEAVQVISSIERKWRQRHS